MSDGIGSQVLSSLSGDFLMLLFAAVAAPWHFLYFLHFLLFLLDGLAQFE